MQPYKCIYLEVVSLKISLVSLKISFIFCTRRSQYTKNVSTVSVYERHWGGLDPPRLTRVVHSTCLVFHFLLWIRVLTFLEDPLIGTVQRLPSGHMEEAAERSRAVPLCPHHPTWSSQCPVCRPGFCPGQSLQNPCRVHIPSEQLYWEAAHPGKAPVTQHKTAKRFVSACNTVIRIPS